MKITIKKISLFVIIISLAASCKKKPKEVSVAEQGERFIEIPCSVSQSKDYVSNKKYWRANSIGESADQMISKKKAASNARADLASTIQTTIKGTIDNYVNSREFNNREEVEERFEGLTREVINQQLNNVRTICEKQALTAANKYKTYMAIEMSVDDVQEAMHERLSKDERLKVDYDYEKFKETFDKEMDKFEQGY